MRRFPRASTALVLTAFGLCACTPATVSSLPEDEVSLPRATEVMRQLLAFGDRSPGANKEVADAVAARFRDAGISDVKIEQFPIPHFAAKTTTLEVTGPASLVATLEHLPNQFGGAGQIEAPLVDMDNGRAQVQAAKGKIVLIDALQTASIRTQYQNAIDSGAVGVIFNSNVNGGYLRQRHIWRFERQGEVSGPIPAMSISKEKAAELRAHVKAGETVTIRMSESYEVAGASGYSVLARIPGTDFPDKRVVINAHLDSWFGGAVDDAQAVAALTELAHVLVKTKPRYTIELAAFDVEETGLLGSAEYLRNRVPQARDEIVAAITLEMLAPKNPELTIISGDPLQRDDPNAVWDKVFDQSGLNELFTTPLTASDLMLVFNGEVPLDQKNFWEIGVPGYFLVTTYEPFHSILDTEEACDPQRLEKVIKAVARSVLLIQNYPPETLQLRPASGLTVALGKPLAPVAGQPLTGTLSVTKAHAGTAVNNGVPLVTLYDGTGATILAEATVTRTANDGEYAYTFTLPLEQGKQYMLSASVVSELSSGRNWFKFTVP